jgi:P-type conjugative transfer protein TrbJ
MRKRIAVLALLVLLLIPAPVAQAQFMVCWSCATEWTQLINKVQLIGIYAEQVRMYADMVKQAATYRSLPWSKIDAAIRDFEMAAQYGIGIVTSMQNADVIFRDRFPGYVKPGVVPYHVRYASWAETLRDTLTGVIRASNQQHRELADESMVIRNLRDAAMGNKGRQQTLQAQAALMSEIPAQIMKLREMMQADISSKAIYQGYQMEQQNAAVSGGESFFSFTKEPDRGRKSLGVR